jgi:hypothetical protein
MGFVAVRSLLACAVVACVASSATGAPSATCPQAVDGINSELAGLGGSFANKAYYGAKGSAAFPLGCGIGGQVDADATEFEGRFLGQIAGHLFWRDPTKGLLGLYGSYAGWDKFGGVTVAHISPEAELYFGRFTLRGIAGVEFGNSASAVENGFLTTYDVKTRFFDQVNLEYFVTDDFKLVIGHRYLGGKNALALGSEWGFQLTNGVMASLFAEGRIGEGDYHGIWGGLRFYFGHTNKSLIRRQREDDPNEWDTYFQGAQTPIPTSSVPPVTPPVEED